MRDTQKRYSFRKYRGIGLASVAIATLFFGLAMPTVAANDVTSQPAHQLAVVGESVSPSAPLVSAGENLVEPAVATEPVLTASQGNQNQLSEIQPESGVSGETDQARDSEGDFLSGAEPNQVVTAEPVLAEKALETSPSREQADAASSEEAKVAAPQASSELVPARETASPSRVGFRSAALPLASERARTGGQDQAEAVGLPLATPTEVLASTAGTPERLATVVAELRQAWGQGATYESLTDDERARYEAAIYNEYANHLVENVFPNIQPVTAYTQIPTRESTPLFIKYVQEERRNPVHNGNAQAAVAAAQARVMTEYNNNLTHDPTVAGYTAQSPELVQSLIHRVVAGQSLGAIEAQKRHFFGGLYLLHSQYGFDERLPELLVTQSPVVTTTPPLAPVTAFDNLVRIGQQAITSQVRNKSDLGNLLGQNQAIFDRAIKPLTGLTSQLDLVEKLAQSKNQSATDYLLERSRANIQLASQLDREGVTAWLANNTRLLIPILAQGEGLLVGLTRDSVTVGLVDVYRTTEVPGLTESSRGQAQTEQAQVVAALDDFEHFNTFLRDASAYGDNQNPMAAKPLVFRDSLILTNNQNQRVWQTKATHATVRNFFAPLGMDSASYVVSQNFGGQAESENSIVSFGVKAFAKDKSGVMLYAHEMTHVNDERLLFEGAYGGTAANNPLGANRRQGQGPELYARGLFEPMDNSQTATSTIRPAFNLNTSITIPSGANNDAVAQIQPSEALDTVNKLATYQHKLIKLLMWMEAKEAEAVLALPEADRLAYFNQVEQVVRPGTAQTPSTNDNFVRPAQAPQTLEDLVRGSYVTATYVANGTNRLGLVQTNGYNFVPLFDGFYGANYAPAGQNTVGDISFKRNAHEILGWYGFDAMIDYLSGKSSSDQDFLTKLRTRQAGEAMTLEGKLEADPQATKLKQYQELLKLDLQDVPDEIKAIFTETSLKQAIQADLAVLKQPNVTDGTVYASAVNVRKLKQNLLSQLIETTEMMDTDPAKQVLGEKTYDVIYVANGANGNGETALTPMGNLTEALAKVRENGRIVLVGDVTERTPVTINKALTIEGSQADRALLLNQDLTTTKPVTLKGLTLQLNKESQATGLIRAQADLILDGVSTKISDRQEDQRPAILLEGDRAVSLQVLNNRDTKLASITATTESSLLLDKGVTVVGAVQAQTAEPVTVTSRTNFATEFSGDTLSLTLSENSPAEMTLDGIQSLTLRDGARASLSEDTNSSINDQLTIAAGSILDATINNLSVRTLDGTGTLRFDESAFFEAEHSRAGTTIEVTNDTLAYQDEKTYVIIPSRDVEPAVSLVQLNTQLTPNEDGHYIYKAPYQLFHEFEALDSNLTLPASVEGLLTAFTDNEELTAAPQKPANPAQTSVNVTDGRWEFKGWVLELDDQAPKIHVYKGQWTYTPKPSTVLLTYAFAVEGKDRDQFPENQVTLPAQATVDKGSAFVQPAAYTQVFESRDGQGEWQFKNWSLPAGSIVQANQTITGTWTYHAYRTIPITTSYQANDQAEVGTANTIVTAGRVGLQSALTDRIVRDMQPRVEQVGTKPRVVTNRQDPETLYEADLNLDYGADNVLKQSGQPRVTTTTTTYRLENGRAVANAPVVTTESGRPTIYRVGTKPTVIETSETLPVVYKSDDQLAVGQPNRVETVGQPTLITTTTTYRIENGQAVANRPTVSRTTGVAQVEFVGTKPTVVETTETLPVVYKSDDQLAVGQPNRVETIGQPKVTRTTTTYRIENGQAVANQPTVSRTEGVARVEFVGTKPKVVETTETLPVIYKSDDQLDVGQPNRVETIGQPKVTRTTTTYRIENGQVVANTPIVSQTEGIASVEVVGTKPRVVETPETLPVIYKSDDQLDVGQPNRVETVGQPRVTTTTTTYRIENGQAVANTPTVKQTAGVARVEVVGTKPTVERVETATEVLYESDGTLEVGSANVLKQAGQPGVSIKTTTYRLENGKAVPNTPSIQTESGRPTIYRVGTKPTVVETTEPLPTVYKADDQVAVGQPNRVETAGQPRLTTITTTYRLENGQAVANTPTVSRIEGVARVEFVGTKPTVVETTETLPIVYKSDDQFDVGQPNRVETVGQPRVTTTTTTYRIENGQVVANTPTVSRTAGVAQVEFVGTKPTVVETTETLPVIYKSDDQVAVGQPNRVETAGQPRVTTTTTTYRIENGQAVANTPNVSRTAGVAQVELVGTKPKVERVETATQVLYEGDDSLEVGSTNALKQTGQPGVSIKTTTYRLENGRAVANAPVVTAESGRPTIYRVGTKPKVLETTETLPVVYKSDDQLAVGQPNRVEIVGQPRATTTTTTYRIENGQAVVNTPTVSRTEGVARVEFVGTKPTVVETTETLPIVYKSDGQLDVGQPNRVETAGQPKVTRTTTTYRIENGQAVANTPTVKQTAGVTRVEVVGTKPTVERVETATQVVYEADDTLEVGSANVLKQAGQPGVSIKTTTYRLENGRAVANAPVVTAESGRPTIYRVGTKPTVVETTEPLPTVYKADDQVAVGQPNRVETAGQPRLTTTTTTYRIENGQAVANTPTVKQTAGVARVEVVGTKPTVERVETAVQVVYEADDTLEVGSPNILKQAGQPGVSIKTTTYRLENGRAVANESSLVTESGRPTIYRVGIKPTVVETTETLPVIYKSDDQLDVGQPNRVETIGQPKVTRTTTTYRIENGQAVANPSTTDRKPGIARVEVVGTKPKVVETTETLPIIYKSDNTLAVGQPNRIETVGQPTVITTTTTYRIENGQAVANPSITDRKPGTARVEVVGTKPKVVETTEPLPIIYKSDDTLEVGQANRIETAGQPTVITTTTTYRIENGQAVANTPTVKQTAGVARVEVVGTKPTVVETTEPLPTVYKADDQLDVGQPNLVETLGQPRVTTTTTTYRIENGQAVANKPTVSRTEGVARVEFVGTKPKVERVETAAQILYEADDSLEVGSTNVLKQTGQPGVSITTTTYRLEDGKAVANDPIETAESGRPTIYRVGTKPTVVETTEPLPVVYKSDDQLAVGQPNRVETIGQPSLTTTTTTYRIENGQAVANTPTVSRTEGVAQIEFVGTKPTVVDTTETLPVIYKSDDQLDVGQPNRVEKVGQPSLTTTTTTYRIENGQAVANTSTVSRTEGVARIEFVGTKPTVTIETITLSTIYEDDPTLVAGSDNEVKQIGQPTVRTTTVTYRLENGRAVANEPQVTTILGQPEIQLVGIKQEQNGGSDTTEPLPTFDPSADSDGDGFSNGDELTAGSDPYSADSVPARQNGGSDTAEPLPTFDPSADSDGDGFSNGDELTAGSDPFSGASIPANQNGGSDTVAPLPTFDPSADADGDGFSNGDELTAGSDPHSAASVPSRQNGGSDTVEPLPTFDPSADSDGDGFSNGDELTAGSDPYSADSVPARQNGGSDTAEPLPTFDPSTDSDGDGFSNGDELTAGSDPFSGSSIPASQNGGRDTVAPLPTFDPSADADGDGFSNGDELTAGSDPHSAASVPSQEQDKVTPSRLPQDTLVQPLPLVVERPILESTKSSATTPTSARLPETGDSAGLLGLGVLTLLTGVMGFVRRRDERD